MMGNNLPPANEVVDLYRSNNIRRMRLYDPNQDALQALRDSGIELILVGNEVSPVGGTSWYAQYVLHAIQNIYQAIRAQGLHDQIKVSTSIDMTLLESSYPPSQGSFRGDVRSYLDPIIGYLVYASAPLLVNVYPYFSYANNPRDISLSYALFTSPNVMVWDGQYGYQNLFDAMLDAVHAAIDNTRIGYVPVVVSESGWPSDGGFAASYDNARIYIDNLIRHVGRGTPRRPWETETYLFAMFDENMKNPETEKHFGLFYPNKQRKYPFGFGGESDEFNTTVSLNSDM
ncbi:Glycoside hydrolase family 17 [Sesbania bispinosa]|nr:Glycoside hydrolase family 17 [Sesbania bispinosa]